MSGLEETFKGRIQFIVLDWDDPTLNGQREKLGITDRTQYVLVDDTGTVVKRWYGILNENQVEVELETAISS